MLILSLLAGCALDEKTAPAPADTGDPADTGGDACTPVPWWDDADHDGYGDPLAAHEDCDPAGATEAGDCDDAEAAVNPAAIEICNGIDDDCDGLTDGSDAADGVSAWTDADGDGVGDTESPVVACAQDDGVSQVSGDCDDTDATVYPGADDVPGDGADTDCDGSDSAPYTGCSPIDVPDTWPTIEDALAAGEVEVCLGEGTFSPTAYVSDYVSGFWGQGPDRTTVIDPSAYYPTSTLVGLTAVGTVSGDEQGWYTDVRFEDATIGGPLQQIRSVRVAWIRTTLPLIVQDRDGSLDVQDSWFTGASPAISVTSSGCTDSRSCVSDNIALSIRESTFTDNDVAIDLALEDLFDVSLTVQDSIFAGQTDGVLQVSLAGNRGATPALDLYGNDNLVWDSGSAHWLTGQSFPATDADPLLDLAYAPPRPETGSPAIGAAGSGATATDYWGFARDDADLGVIEY